MLSDIVAAMVDASPSSDTSAASRRLRGRFGPGRLLLWALATLALNLLFLAVVDAYRRVVNDLSLEVNGAHVRATLDETATSEWRNAPTGKGKVTLSISRPIIPSEPVGIGRVKVTWGDGQAFTEDFDSASLNRDWGEGWHVDRWHGQLIHPKSGPAEVVLPGVTCGDCTIDIELVNALAAEIFVHGGSRQQGLAASWRAETLAWDLWQNGEKARSEGVERLPLYEQSNARRQQRYAADIMAFLWPGYLVGLDFLKRLALAMWPSFAIVAALGALGWLWRSVVTRDFALATPFTQGWKWPLAWVLSCATCAYGVYSYPPFRSEPTSMSAVAAIIAGLTGITVLLGVLRDYASACIDDPACGDRLRSTTATVLAVSIACLAGGYSAYASRHYLGGIPHVQDSASYLLAAKALTLGNLKVPMEPELRGFFFLPTFFDYRDGYLMPLMPGWYFAGHPIMLALGYLAGAEWIANPVTSAVTLVLLYLLCRRLFGAWNAVLAVAIAAISPFARFQSASLMAHPTQLLFTVAALLMFVYWVRDQRATFSLSIGLALGALLNVRLFDGLVLGLFIGIAMLVHLPRFGPRVIAKHLAFMGLAVVPLAALILWQTEVLSAGGDLQGVAARTVAWMPENLMATNARLLSLNEELLGWPFAPEIPKGRKLTIGVLLLGMLLMPKKRADWFIVGWALLYPAAYSIYDWHGNMFGPRYWYGSLGGFAALIARVFTFLPGLLMQLSDRIWPPGRSAQWRWIPLGLAILPVAALALPLAQGTLTSYRTRFISTYSDDYNGFNRRVFDLLEEAKIRRGLVFVADSIRWQHLVAAIATNDPTFDGPIVFARYVEGEEDVLIKARPNRKPYLISWNGSDLELAELVRSDGASEWTVAKISNQDRATQLLEQSNIFKGVPLPLGFSLVGGAAAGADGSIYILSSATHEVLIFRPDGAFQRRIRLSYNVGPSAIKAGEGIAVDSEGNVYVVDRLPPSVIRFNADGTFAWRRRMSSDGKQVILDSASVAVMADGNLLVTDAQPRNSTGLHILRPDGTLDGYFGKSAGEGNEQPLRKPVGVAVAPNGHVFVSDMETKHLVELDADGGEVRRWHMPIERHDPQDPPFVAVDQDNVAYVSSTREFVVWRTPPDGGDTLVKVAKELNYPSGIFPYRGGVYVLEAGPRRVTSLHGT